MGVLGNIMSRIFHKGAAAAPAASQGTAGQSAAASKGMGTAPQAGMESVSASKPTAAAPQKSTVDVEALLTEMAAKNGQKLDWKKSIVDLMKLLDLDSSLASRKELAKELHYSGDTNDSATMNIWLHKQVMAKVAENGGKVPQELRA